MQRGAGFRRSLWIALLCVLAAAGAASAQARSAASLLEQARAATGGDAWNRYAECDSEARIQVLVDGRAASGTLHTFENLKTGAVVSAMAIPALGVRREDGADTAQSWTVNKAGAVSVRSATDPWQVDERYMTSRGYWRPGFGGAQATVLPSAKDGGATFDRVRIDVPGGHGFVLWISRTTHRIERLEWNGMREYSDFRRVGGVLLPFTERDAGGAHEVVAFVSRKLRARVNEADFAGPGAGPTP